MTLGAGDALLVDTDGLLESHDQRLDVGGVSARLTPPTDAAMTAVADEAVREVIESAPRRRDDIATMILHVP